MNHTHRLRLGGIEYDMHNHSNRSKDGRTPPKWLIKFAAMRGLAGIGICDHDTLPDESLYDFAAHRRIKLALGTEFTCRQAHVIGYGMTLTDGLRARLKSRFDGLRTSWEEATRAIIHKLTRFGLCIRYEDIREYCGQTPQKTYLFKYLSEKMHYFSSWGAARRFVHAHHLDVADEAAGGAPHPAETVELIHEAGGAAVWAHPFMTPEPLRRRYFGDLLDAGLDGIEAVYAYRENGYCGSESNAVLQAKTLAMIGDTRLAVFGGSDSHYPVKTHADKRPVLPGDFGLTRHDVAPYAHLLR